jgi:hypothetical protein
LVNIEHTPELAVCVLVPDLAVDVVDQFAARLAQPGPALSKSSEKSISPGAAREIPGRLNRTKRTQAMKRGMIEYRIMLSFEEIR